MTTDTERAREVLARAFERRNQLTTALEVQRGDWDRTATFEAMLALAAEQRAVPEGVEGECDCARRSDPDQFDHQPQCRFVATPQPGASSEEGARGEEDNSFDSAIYRKLHSKLNRVHPTNRQRDTPLRIELTFGEIDRLRTAILTRQSASSDSRVRELEEALERLTTAMRLIMPITTNNTADYAEIAFGDHPTQAMTMIPDTWIGITAAYDAARAALASQSPEQGHE